MKCFILNNGKNDLGKFDARSDEGAFVGYSPTSKSYRVFNKRTNCVEESIHVKFDEVRTKDDNKDDHEMEELTEDREITQEVEETYAKSTEGPGPLDISPNTESHDSSKDEGNFDDDREEEITRKSRWKHQSSHPLDNLISPLESEIQTRSMACNMVAFLVFLSLNEPKSIKEALKDPDCVVFIQEELHQFE